MNPETFNSLHATHIDLHAVVHFVVWLVCFAAVCLSIVAQEIARSNRCEKAALRGRIERASTRRQLLDLRREASRLAGVAPLSDGDEAKNPLFALIDRKLSMLPRVLDLFPGLVPTESGQYAVVGDGWQRVIMVEVASDEHGLTVREEAHDPYTVPLDGYVRQYEAARMGNLRWSARLDFAQAEFPL